MHKTFLRTVFLLCAAAAAAVAQAPPPNPPAYVPSDDERSKIVAGATELGKRISLIRARAHDDGLLADVEVYWKAAQWLLRYPEEFYNRNYAGQALLVLERGIERARQLEQGQSPWASRKGQRVARAYRSRVDDSLQPYHVVVPDSYDPARPMRLDVVLHGRGATLSEISFLAQAESAKPGVAYPDRIELHVFGRTNNAYRWAGETDVFEALESVRKRYRVDEARTVLRGFSMGGAGTWHIGLHHPDLWAGIEAGAGFTETRRYARQNDVPPYVEAGWHIYDAVDYARNAFQVPTVGYGGEIDPQLQASVNIREQLAREALQPAALLRVLFLVGPQTPHRFHPESKKESDAFLDRYVAPGRQTPEKIRFVAYTTRYNRCFWITVDGLDRHYERAEVDADGGVVRTRNVSRLSLRRPGAVEIDGQKFGKAGSFEKRNGRWAPAGKDNTARKRQGMQGPIDDAFMDSFLVVKPTGAAPALARERMERFLEDFAKWMRGDARTADDNALTAAQIRDHHLVLFGDPASNAVIRRIEAQLPLRFAGAGGLPVMIAPNPLNPQRYVVINSGHTFGEKDFRGTNALLFPRLGDWAVLGEGGAVIKAGLFDEQWRLPR